MIFYHYVIRQGSITTSKDKTKNGIDLLDICNELIIFSNTIKDEELRKLLQNRIAMVYMKAVYIGKLYRKEFRNCIDKKFPLHYSYFIKDKSKSIIFYISRYLYCLINDMK